jgi:hypothetical protein
LDLEGVAGGTAAKLLYEKGSIVGGLLRNSSNLSLIVDWFGAHVLIVVWFAICRIVFEGG